MGSRASRRVRCRRRPLLHEADDEQEANPGRLTRAPVSDAKYPGEGRSMTTAIVPNSELARRREERQRQRRERAAMAGTIMGLLDDDDQPVCVASKPKETTR
jgi:hypothetical protein